MVRHHGVSGLTHLVLFHATLGIRGDETGVFFRFLPKIVRDMFRGVDVETKVDLEGAAFCEHRVWRSSLVRLRRALVTHAMAVKRMHAHRKHTNKTCVIAESSAAEFKEFMTMSISGVYTISPVLEEELKRAENEIRRAAERTAAQQGGPSSQ